ncbi:MAG: permease-like cell division protein FtsX [Gammaproteobacteria bacterium]
MAKPSRRGASVARTRSPGRLRQYFQHHIQTFVASLGRLWRQPFASLMTVLVIGMALAMPALLHLLVQNARAVTGDWDSAVDLSVYLELDVAPDAISNLSDTLRARADVADVRVIDAQTALSDFRAHSGFGAALDALDGNPLPATLIVTPPVDQRSDDDLAQLARQISDLDNVALVQLDTEWVKRFHGLLEVVRRGTLLASALLALSVLVIVGNTIRMDILNRRAEIEIVKLIGASDGFIRRPFLYSGLWYGLAGGVMASLLLLIIFQLIRGPITSLAGLYGSDYALLGLGLPTLLMLIVGGGALGWIGSWIAATRHMRRIEPTM